MQRVACVIIALVCTLGTANSALSTSTVSAWRQRDHDKRYTNDNWRNRRNYRKGYRDSSYYPAGNAIGNREYYPTDGYTR
jgi:hypothetical protein